MPVTGPRADHFCTTRPWWSSHFVDDDDMEDEDDLDFDDDDDGLSLSADEFSGFYLAWSDAAREAALRARQQAAIEHFNPVYERSKPRQITGAQYQKMSAGEQLYEKHPEIGDDPE